MADHTCVKESDWGKVKEFMEGFKGMKTTLLIISCSIAIQVGSFLYLWGGLNTTVVYHDRAIVKLESQYEVLRKMENK